MIRKLYLTAGVVAAGAVVAGGIAQATGVKATTAGSPPVQVVPLERFGAFSRPQQVSERAFEETSAAREVIDVLTSDDPAVSAGWKPGEARRGLRILLAGLGASKRTIFSFETTRGVTCAGLSDFTSGCFTNLPKNGGISVTFGDPDFAGGGEGVIVWGVASNRVAAIEVIVAGTAHAAIVGNNAYFFQLENASLAEDALEEILVTDRNNEHHVVPVSAGPRIPVGFGG